MMHDQVTNLTFSAVMLCKVPRHTDSRGNELADEAKKTSITIKIYKGNK